MRIEQKGELQEYATCKDFLQVQNEGSKIYNTDIEKVVFVIKCTYICT
jgi:hypothetical protein